MSVMNSLSSLAASPLFLRRVLWLDATTGGVTGLLQLLLADQLAAVLGLPVSLLVASGWVIFGYVALIAFIATRPFIAHAGVWLLIAANGLWVLGCLVLLFGGMVAPTLLGKGFIAVQAVVVGLLAELQWVGLRRAAARPAW
ncbi:hypothetical protein [Polaromonas sp.]|uniref:hypothetical protein n=1 Tax=Polaromonas sp. TaxID=1869339 RepID=UPI00356AA53C